jgi:c-di-GMP phosphodiesterase
MVYDADIGLFPAVRLVAWPVNAEARIMSSSVKFSHVHYLPSELDFFMTRWPVLDRDHQLVAHELVFRIDGRSHGFSHGHETGSSQTAGDMRTLLGAVADHGMARLLDRQTGYLEIDGDVLSGDIPDAIPRDLVVLVIRPGATAALTGRIEELAAEGLQFALDVQADTRVDCPELLALLPLVHTVRIDVSGKDALSTVNLPGLSSLCAFLKTRGKTLVAAHVDTMQQFHSCAAIGIDRFQGYYFAEPCFPKGKTLQPSQIAIAELMSLIASDADDAAIEQAIKMDVSLGLNLLRLVNTPAVSTHRIDSLRQALMVMGRSQLQRWLQVLLYSESKDIGPVIVPLLTQAATRGRLMELLAQSVHPSNRGMADTAFTVGIMSLMEVLFSVPMKDILATLPVAEEVQQALLERSGFFGRMLALAEHLEKDGRELTSLTPSLREFRVQHADLYAMQLSAYEWSDRIARLVR